jgi:hypothetical protein
MGKQKPLPPATERHAPKRQALGGKAAGPASPIRRPLHPGRTAIEAWRRDALAIERAAAGKDADEVNESDGATNRRCWLWIAMCLALIGGLLLVQLWRQCWSWTTTIGC